MNAIIFEKLNALDSLQQQQLLTKIDNSPSLLRLYHIIRSLNKPHFNNYEVVEQLYPSEINVIEYPKLENRYFKLRKTLIKKIDELYKDSTNSLTHLEERIFNYRIKGNTLTKKDYKDLLELEKEIFKLNLFDFLPKVYELIIAYNQNLNKLDTNLLYWKKYENALELSKDIQTMLMLSKKAYEENYRYGFEGLKKVTDEMLKIANKHKSELRFQLIYHFVSLYYKLSTENYKGKQKAVARHFNKVKNILNENPQMPIIWYKPGYLKSQQNYLREISAFYHYSRLEFSEAYQKFLEIWNISNADPDTKRVSETVYYNMVQACIATKRFHKAIVIAEEMIEKFKDFHKYAMAHITYLDVYVSGYPLVKSNKVDFILEKANQFLLNAKAKGDRNMIFKAAVVICKAFYLKGDTRMAIKTLSDINETQAERTSILFLLNKFFLMKTESEKKEYLDHLIHLQNEIEGPELFNNIEWIIEILHYQLLGKRKYFTIND